MPALKQRAARSGFTSGLLQRQIGDGPSLGDGSHADGDQQIFSMYITYVDRYVGSMVSVRDHQKQ
jgi:hypothetical protein